MPLPRGLARHEEIEGPIAIGPPLGPESAGPDEEFVYWAN